MNKDHTRILAEIEANRGCLENVATEDLQEAQSGWHDTWYISLYESKNSLFSPDFDLHSDIAFELDRRKHKADMDKIDRVKQVIAEKKKKMKSFF